MVFRVETKLMVKQSFSWCSCFLHILSCFRLLHLLSQVANCWNNSILIGSVWSSKWSYIFVCSITIVLKSLIILYKYMFEKLMTSLWFKICMIGLQVQACTSERQYRLNNTSVLSDYFSILRLKEETLFFFFCSFISIKFIDCLPGKNF